MPGFCVLEAGGKDRPAAQRVRQSWKDGRHWVDRLLVKRIAILIEDDSFVTVFLPERLFDFAVFSGLREFWSRGWRRTRDVRQETEQLC